MTGEQLKEAFAGLKALAVRVAEHASASHLEGARITDGIDGLRESLETATKDGFEKLIDDRQIAVIMDDLEARAKDYCGEESGGEDAR